MNLAYVVIWPCCHSGSNSQSQRCKDINAIKWMNFKSFIDVPASLAKNIEENDMTIVPSQIVLFILYHLKRWFSITWHCAI